MATESEVLNHRLESVAVSKTEAAEMLGVSLRTVDRLIALKELPCGGWEDGF